MLLAWCRFTVAQVPSTTLLLSSIIVQTETR